MSDGGASGPGQPRRTDPSDGWTVLSYLISGLLLWGGVGWLLDRWLGTSFLLPTGLLVGITAALYLVYIRYGKP
jgi:ATP synthase protein I